MLEFARYVSSSPQLENLADNTRNLFGNFAKAGPSIRSYFFINLLDVVSSIPTTNPEDTSFGRTEWEQLLKNTTFRTEILANPRWANDQRVLNNLGLATAIAALVLDAVPPQLELITLGRLFVLPLAHPRCQRRRHELIQIPIQHLLRI